MLVSDGLTLFYLPGLPYLPVLSTCVLNYNKSLVELGNIKHVLPGSLGHGRRF